MDYENYVIRYEEYLNELYKIFDKFGVNRQEFHKLIPEIKLDRKKTSGFMSDLMLYTFIKKGLRYRHLEALSRLLGHNKFRSGQLRRQLEYLNTLLDKMGE